MMGAEDFSWYGEKVPYVFGFLGSRDEEKGYVYSNHQEQYCMDESLLERSVAVMAQFAADFLNQ